MATPLSEKSSNSSLSGKAGEYPSLCILTFTAKCLLIRPRRAGERSRLRETSLESEVIHTEKLPPNFGEVVKGVYRSSFPQLWHFQALKKLGLRMIV
jgi:tyrosine-protein phosphatase SIW14